MKPKPLNSNGIRSTNANDYKNCAAYVTKREALRVLGVAQPSLNNYQSRADDPLPRYKADDDMGTVYYEIKELFEWYYRHRVKKEFGAGTTPSEAGHEPKLSGAAKEKVRLTKAQADAQEIKNQVARGELAPIQVLEDSLSDLCGQISSKLGAIPSKLRKKYSWLKTRQLDLIQLEIAKAQNEAADIRLDLPDVTQDQQADIETLIGLEDTAAH